MKAKYLLRLDDASPFSDFTKWKAIEEILQRYKILPIVAVIPDNKDSDLLHQKTDPNFWNQIRDWDKKGWTIAIHGYQHKFHKVNYISFSIAFFKFLYVSGLSNFLLLIIKVGVEFISNLFALSIRTFNI